jgi:dTDP-glucose pyrophosphorylase
MKAIIPVAGAGTKLRPHTYTQPKALIPIAGKTILSFIVDQLHEAGINEFIFIVGYLGEKIQDYVTQTYPHLTTHFVHQNERQGTGHAIELTKAKPAPVQQNGKVTVVDAKYIQRKLNEQEKALFAKSADAVRQMNDALKSILA